LDETLLYTLFQPGKTVVLQRTNNVNALLYVESMMRVIMADASGVLAQLAKQESTVERGCVFVPFDGTTTFCFVAPGFSQYSQLVPTTPVIDLESNASSGLGEFYAPFFEPEAPVAGAPLVAPEEQPEWLREFQPGTVFQFATTENVALTRYLSRIFQITHADVNGVLALPERNSGLSEAVYFPFDGKSAFTLNPAGTFSFASGIGAGQQVYNPVTSSYMVVEDFAPTYGYYWEPAPVVYFDTYVPTVGFGVVYDPWYVDPYWP
jgi:hypothetical protein